MSLDHSRLLKQCAFTMLLLTTILQQLSPAQCQLQKIQPNNPAFFHFFGHAIAADADRVAIGAHAGNELSLYEFDGVTWTETFNYKQPQLELGDSVGLYGRWMGSGGPAGSVFLFSEDSNGWHWSQKLTASDPGFSLFGAALALGEGVLLVGAPWADGPNGEVHVGAVYAFGLDATGQGWVRKQKMMPSELEPERAFGMSLALDQSNLVVGAPGMRADQTGKAYVFENTVGTWTEREVLSSPSGETENGFGDLLTVAVSGDAILVGAWSEGRIHPGAVFAYQRAGSEWLFSQELRPTDPDGRMRFGNAVAMKGTEAVIGAWGDTENGGYVGAAYHFRREARGWVQTGKVLANAPGPDDALGSGIAISEGMALVGAQNAAMPNSPLAGAVYVFDLEMGMHQYCSCPDQGPCMNDDDHGGCANSTGQGAVLQACGSATVMTDDIELQSRWMPKSVPGIIIMGPRPDESFLGDGILCVGPGDKGLFRFPGGNSGPEGVITLGPGIVAYSHANFPMAGHIQAGDTWYFQAWYRDPNGPCGSGFNLSNGLKVEFTQ